MKALIAQVQQPQPQPAPITSPQFYGGLGVLLAIITGLGTIFARTFPNYLERFFQLREDSTRANISAQQRERDSDLKRDESVFQTVIEILKTLIANLLQSSTQSREEIFSIQQIQLQQLGLILQKMETYERNQSKFFDLADQIKKSLADVQLEIEKNRKAINDKSI
jgi:hypothetical protein